MKCRYCENAVPEGRVEIGKDYCMAKSCVDAGLVEARSRYVEVGYGKSGVDIVPRENVTPEAMKSTGNRGRS